MQKIGIINKNDEDLLKWEWHYIIKSDTINFKKCISKLIPIQLNMTPLRLKQLMLQTV